MEQHRNSQTSLLSTIMGPTGLPLAKVRETGEPVTASDIQDLRAKPNAGPRKVRSGGQSRAIRRARKAGRANRTEKVQKQTAVLQRQREQLLDTAAAFARIWFAGPPTGQPKKGVSAYERIRQRVYKQAEGLVESGKASSWEDAVEQIETSMRETIRQHDVLLAQKITSQLAAEKQAQMDALRSRIDARTGHPVVG